MLCYLLLRNSLSILLSQTATFVSVLYSWLFLTITTVKPILSFAIAKILHPTLPACLFFWPPGQVHLPFLLQLQQGHTPFFTFSLSPHSVHLLCPHISIKLFLWPELTSSLLLILVKDKYLQKTQMSSESYKSCTGHSHSNFQHSCSFLLVSPISMSL